MEIKPFGDIDPDNLEGYYDGEITIARQTINIDLNFESETIKENQLLKLTDFLKTIELKAKESIDAISEDYDLDEDSETARFYLQHHLEEFSDKEIISLFGKPDVDKQDFLDHLELVRIGLYPEDDDAYAIFDVQFPDEYTNYLMAITFNNEGEVCDVSMES